MGSACSNFPCCCVPVIRGRPYVPLEDQEGLLPTVQKGYRQELGTFLTRSSLPKITPTYFFPCTNSSSPSFESLLIPESEYERQRLADKWTKAGQAEHASVASFALFTQKLLVAGAPQEMVQESLLCANEEVFHASLCFGLASMYHGTPVQAHVYSAHQIKVTPDLEDIFLDTVREGCVGETVAALEAAIEAEEAEDPLVKAVSSKIAIDEAYHASYAWRVVRWIIQTDPSKYEPLLQATISEQCGSLWSRVHSKSSCDVINALADHLIGQSPFASVSSIDCGHDYSQVMQVLQASVQ